MFKENFHTHLDYCGHATGRATDYIATAQKAGFYALGFSEHTPFPPHSYHTSRLQLKDMDNYCNEILTAKKNSPLKIYLALELDIEPSLEEFYDTLLVPYPFDYFIGSVHTFMAGGIFVYTPDITTHLEATTYMHLLIEASKNKRFSFIGHPDRFYYSPYVSANLNQYEQLWHEFCASCVQNDKPIELNTSNDYPYFYENDSPLLHFWQIVAHYNLKVVINSDAHNPTLVQRHFDKAYPLAQQLGLNVISFSQYLNEKK